MLMVLLLVVMFTGIGLLAIRHIRGEMRSAGAYRDSLQAASAAEAALAMQATDMRLYFDVTCDDGESYHTQFVEYRNASATRGLRLKFSPYFRGGEACVDDPGLVPDAELSGASALARTTLFANSVARVTLEQDFPIPAAPPAGFSSKQAQNYGFYYFTLESKATYGHRNAPAGMEKGEAIARSRMMIGPITRF